MPGRKVIALIMLALAKRLEVIYIFGGVADGNLWIAGLYMLEDLIYDLRFACG